MPGEANNLNPGLDYAGRVADYMEFAEVLALDALERARILRRPLPRGVPDAGRRGASATIDEYTYVAAWEFKGVGDAARSCTRSRWCFEEVHPTQRSYK